MRAVRVLGMACLLAIGMPMASQAAEPLLMPESKLPHVKSVRVFGQKIVYYAWARGRLWCWCTGWRARRGLTGAM